MQHKEVEDGHIVIKHSYACAPLAIKLTYMVEKHNTLITVNLGGPLQAKSSEGRKHYNTSTTGNCRGQNPRGRRDSGSDKENLIRQGGKTIGDEGGTP